MGSLFTLAAEGGHIGPDSLWADIAVPLGIVIFVGPVYLLLRSNLGTRLGYLIMSTSLWGATFLLALFWTFGAPGTPAFTGPQNLPGQELDAYIEVWVPFAQDAPIVTETDSPYAVAADFPGPAWTSGTPEGMTEEEAFDGVAEISNVFTSFDGDPYTSLISTEDEVVGTQYAVAENGRPMVAVTYAQTCQLTRQPDPNTEGEFIEALPPVCEDAGLGVGELAPEGSEFRTGANADVTLFAFLDRGNPGFPSYITLAISAILFGLHMVLLARDETRTRKEQEEEAEDTTEVAPDQEQEPVPA